VHYRGAVPVGHRDRNDQFKPIRAVGDLREIRRLQLAPCNDVVPSARPEGTGGLSRRGNRDLRRAAADFVVAHCYGPYRGRTGPSYGVGRRTAESEAE
jgi:hypothetical protein